MSKWGDQNDWHDLKASREAGYYPTQKETILGFCYTWGGLIWFLNNGYQWRIKTDGGTLDVWPDPRKGLTKWHAIDRNQRGQFANTWELMDLLEEYLL
jgi:hypothetical protein